MQAASDIFPGWQRTEKALDGNTHDFYVRQLRDWKSSLDVGAMRPPLHADLRRTSRAVLNRVHSCPPAARSGRPACGRLDARPSDARSGDAIAAYLGGSNVFDQAITEFAAACADPTGRDHQALQTAAATGRIIAVSGN